MKYLILIAIVFMTGCANQVATCEDLGFTRGTKEYGNCKLQLMALEQQKTQSRASVYNSAIQGYNAASQPFYKIK